MNRPCELFIAGSADDVAREAASRFVEAASRAIARCGRCAVALSGGSTPRRLYTLLTQPPYCQSVDWSRIHLFFADERYVPHDHAESTVRLVRETLLAGVPVPTDHFHPMPTLSADPAQSAADYAATLADFFGTEPPEFDLVLLGMGPDGHTASLFPGRPYDAGSVAVVHGSPKPPPTRLTLTLDAINAARTILFLVTGADKAATLATVFGSAADDTAALPAARVMAREGATVWLVDREAGAEVLPHAR